MNKEQFLEIMERQLVRLPKADRDDILSDYEDNFARGLEEGLSEDQVSERLGDPAELAQTYLENLPEGAKGAPYIATEVEAEQPAAEQPTVVEQPVVNENAYTYQAPTYTSPETSTPTYGYAQPAAAKAAPVKTDNSGMIALVVLLSIFVALPVAGAIISAWFTLLGISAGAIGCGIGLMVAAIAAIVVNGMLGAGLMLFGIASFVLFALMIVGLIAGAKGIYLLIKWYVEKCKQIINGNGGLN